MESACIRHTDLPGTSRLFADFSYHFDRVARFYGHDPHSPGRFVQAAREIEYPVNRRAALVAALEAQNGPSEALRKLAEPGTVAVVTGQQVGLFGGPAYTIYKALTAVRLAQDLTAQGIPAVPVFWLATEDHDFPEVAHIYTFDSAHQPVRLHVNTPSDAAGRPRPVGSLKIEHPPVEELRHSLAGFPFGSQIADLVEASYRPGVTMAQGFRTLLKRLLGEIDLPMLDPLDPAIRSLAAPFLAEALAAAPDLKARLLERSGELNAAGYHAQVLVEPKTSLFFLLENGERTTLRRKDSEFASLRDRAADISPNALLRPVLQDYLLPTAAFIGGPGELAYLAQSQVIYDRLLGRMPVTVGRASFTLLENRTAKLLARYKLTLAETMAPEEALRERIAAALIPGHLEKSFVDTAGELDQRLDKLGQEVEQFDPTLGAALSKGRAKMGYQLEKLRRKTAREILRRDARAVSDTRYLSNLLFPHRHVQERFYSILPFLAEHGPDLIQGILDNVTLGCPDHRVLTV